MTGPAEPAASGGAGLPAGFEAIGPPLGVGATAVVWPARRVLDGREFALKVWHRPFADQQERDRFRREVRQHALLSEVSGHVVTYNWAEEDPALGTPWIGTQRYGVSLQQLLEQGRPPLPAGLTLCADLLAGLAAMHELKMVHRDVKPANVIVQDGRAKLCDFGLAMDSAGFTADNAAGSPSYVAPDLLHGTTRPSPRTDVYSAAQTIRQTLGSRLSEPLEQLVTEAASLDPDDRPADAVQFQQRFRQGCADLGRSLPPALAARPPAGEGAERAPQPAGPPRRLLIPVGAAALVLLLVGVAAAITRPDPAAGETPMTVPDAGLAPPDIAKDGKPVLLELTTSGQCMSIVDDAQAVATVPYEVDGTVVAEVQSYYSRVERQACAKLVKPRGSPYRDVKTHLAFTLCGDANTCDNDWQSYVIDAGPLVVPSRNGCVSWRVSMMDDTGTRWIVRDAVQSFGCS